MTRLPLSVIGGYLGAGKTTLINRLLAADHGRRLAVLVNDFGAINIDASLLKSSDAEKIELTNGCVCCTMSGDLFYAIGDLLDERPGPDHVIVEASGISDPARIAQLALAEPDMAYAGILAIIDGRNFPDQLNDPQISEQVIGQARVADFHAVSKVPASEARIAEALARCDCVGAIDASDTDLACQLLFGGEWPIAAPDRLGAPHPDYVKWSDVSPPTLSRNAIERLLARRPDGILRFKALIPNRDGGAWEVHLVGSQSEIAKADEPAQPGAVAIGLHGAVALEEIENWWQSER